MLGGGEARAGTHLGRVVESPEGHLHQNAERQGKAQEALGRKRRGSPCAARPAASRLGLGPLVHGVHTQAKEETCAAGTLFPALLACLRILPLLVILARGGPSVAAPRPPNPREGGSPLDDGSPHPAGRFPGAGAGLGCGSGRRVQRAEHRGGGWGLLQAHSRDCSFRFAFWNVPLGQAPASAAGLPWFWPEGARAGGAPPGRGSLGRGPPPIFTPWDPSIGGDGVLWGEMSFHRQCPHGALLSLARGSGTVEPLLAEAREYYGPLPGEVCTTQAFVGSFRRSPETRNPGSHAALGMSPPLELDRPPACR